MGVTSLWMAAKKLTKICRTHPVLSEFIHRKAGVITDIGYPVTSFGVLPQLEGVAETRVVYVMEDRARLEERNGPPLVRE